LRSCSETSFTLASMSVKSDSTAIHVARMCIDAANIVLVVNLPSTASAIALMPAVATFAISSLSLFIAYPPLLPLPGAAPNALSPLPLLQLLLTHGLDVGLERQLDVRRQAAPVLFRQAFQGLLDFGLYAKRNRVGSPHADTVVARR